MGLINIWEQLCWIKVILGRAYRGECNTNTYATTKNGKPGMADHLKTVHQRLSHWIENRNIMPSYFFTFCSSINIGTDISKMEATAQLMANERLKMWTENFESNKYKYSIQSQHK